MPRVWCSSQIPQQKSGPFEKVLTSTLEATYIAERRRLLLMSMVPKQRDLILRANGQVSETKPILSLAYCRISHPRPKLGSLLQEAAR